MEGIRQNSTESWQTYNALRDRMYEVIELAADLDAIDGPKKTELLMGLGLVLARTRMAMGLGRPCEKPPPEKVERSKNGQTRKAG